MDCADDTKNKFLGEAVIKSAIKMENSLTCILEAECEKLCTMKDRLDLEAVKTKDLIEAGKSAERTIANIEKLQCEITRNISLAQDILDPLKDVKFLMIFFLLLCNLNCCEDKHKHRHVAKKGKPHKASNGNCDKKKHSRRKVCMSQLKRMKGCSF